MNVSQIMALARRFDLTPARRGSAAAGMLQTSFAVLARGLAGTSSRPRPPRVGGRPIFVTHLIVSFDRPHFEALGQGSSIMTVLTLLLLANSNQICLYHASNKLIEARLVSPTEILVR